MSVQVLLLLLFYYFQIYIHWSLVNEMKWKVGSQTVLLLSSWFLLLSLKSHREFYLILGKLQRNWLTGSFLKLNFLIAIISIPSNNIPVITLFPLRRAYDYYYCCVYVYISSNCLFNQDQVRHLNNSIIMTNYFNVP